MDTKFKFSYKESKIFDFLIFPDLLYSSETFESEKSNHYTDMISEDYLNYIKKAEERLKPYKKEIEQFYLDKISFIELIFRLHSTLNYDNEKEYLEMLLELNETEINKSIVYSMMIFNEDLRASEELLKKAEQISLDKKQIIDFIKDSPIEPGAKWNIFCIVEEPTKYMKKYVEMMMKILPIFNEMYSDYEEAVREYGEYLTEFLNANGSKKLEEITNSMISVKMLEDQETNILISAISSYMINMMAGTKTPYIIWGLRMQQFFEAMKEINENKINERVQIFKNLGDRSRYEVLKLIALGQTSTKEIASSLGLTSATISYHINNLLTSKVIKMDKSDSRYSYVVNYELLEEVILALKEDLNFMK